MIRCLKNFVSFSALTLCAMVLWASISAHAQTEPAAQGSQTTEPDRPAVPRSKPDAPAKQKRDGIGRQLAHETNEAAGEGTDETAEFKQSAPVVWIAEHTGLSLQHAYWLCVVLNFAVIGIALIQIGRKHLPGLFRNRTASIQHSMQEAQKASEEARNRLADIEARLAKLDSEIGAMRDAAERDAVAEEARIKAAAEEDTRKIVHAAEQEIAAAAKTARRELTAYAADLAVGLARKQIHVDAATDSALVRDFAGKLTSAPLGPGKDGQ